MSELIINSEVREATVESEEMKGLLKVLKDNSVEIDQIHYSPVEDDICVVPYRSEPIKGYGSFYLTEDEFVALQEAFSRLEFIGINLSDEDEDPKPLKIAKQVSLTIASGVLKG